MAKKQYRILSQEAVERWHEEEGNLVELDLNRDENRAVVAAGWVEEVALEEQSKEQLDQIAAEFAVDTTGLKSKKDLIDAIREKQKEE